MAKYTGPVYTKCARCPGEPDQLVRFYTDDHEEALCYRCWKPLADAHQVKVLHWINKYGQIMFARGAGQKQRQKDSKQPWNGESKK